MDRQPVLAGDRLLLRPAQADDWAAVYAVASDPELWAQHPANDRWQESVFRAFFDAGLASGGMLVAEDRATGAVIGSSRYDAFDPAEGGSVEIGWTFLSRGHWGGGWNGEMKRLMLAHAFRYVVRVDFRIGEGNRRSRIACERIGGVLTDRFEVSQLAGGPVKHVIYAISREAFAAGPLAG